MRVVVADPASLVRSGCRHLLCDDLPGCEILEATSLSEVVMTLRLVTPDALIIDPGISGCQGVSSIHQLRLENSALAIIVLANETVSIVIDAYLRAGANAYLQKALPNDVALSAIRAVLAGASDASPAIHPSEGTSTATSPPQHGPAKVAMPRLTLRQEEVLRLLEAGQSTKDIARSLGLGVGTVKIHLAAVYRIMGARNRLEAIVRSHTIKASAGSMHYQPDDGASAQL